LRLQQPQRILRERAPPSAPEIRQQRAQLRLKGFDLPTGILKHGVEVVCVGGKIRSLDRQEQIGCEHAPLIRKDRLEPCHSVIDRPAD
jgi:hypothetical protein